MTLLDWFVMGVYLVAMLGLALHLGRKQRTAQDYFLGGQSLSSGSLAASTIATQCSTNSLLGAPAFVGFTLGGGLVWLQYELAVPLAMAALLWVMIPARQRGVTSIYTVLEQQLGSTSRRVASGCFLLFRGVATGVTIYGVSLVLALLLEIPYWAAVLLLMVVTIVYDLLGGLRAVVISDVIQLLLLTLTVFVSLWLLAQTVSLDAVQQLPQRTQVLVNDWGFSGNDYGFWPMLFGGFFLYAAYYGADQSQAQRVLATKDAKGTRDVLLLNGLLRFPLVLAYCCLGIGLAAFAATHPEFLQQLPTTANGNPNVNLVFPTYVLQHFAPGLVGLVMVGLIAAAMSSIDSAINSLSAATLEDFIRPWGKLTQTNELLWSRTVTAVWGLACLGFSFQVEAVAPTVLEAINKVGSFANGPLLALLCIALLLRGVPQWAALLGFASGIFANTLLAWTQPNVSWLWWNPHGFGWSVGIAYLAARFSGASIGFAQLERFVRGPTVAILLLAAAAILLISLWIEALLVA